MTNVQSTPKGLRPHIVLAGEVNAGKSSLINALTDHDIAIVSDTPGTTTDPVRRACELVPFGPVVFVDTAGSGDQGSLRSARLAKTQREIDGADLVLYVLKSGPLGERARRALGELRAASIPVIPVVSHIDLSGAPTEELRSEIETTLGQAPLGVSSKTGAGVRELREAIMRRLEAQRISSRSLLEDLVRPFRLILLIVPIDLEAPAGRLILPQVQTIREALDADSAAIVVKEREVDWVLGQLKRPPDLAITDSQVVLKAAGAVPPEIPLTTFSILFSRYKGDLEEFVKNARAIDRLDHGARVLVTESCSHHTHCDDIGRVKIPRWLRQYTGKDLDIQTVGGAMPEEIDDFDLIIHCGSCMITRAQMHARMREARRAAIPMTNYGVAISHLHGVLDRVLEPFADVMS